MTRINLIPVSELGVKHLVAEYRELPRIFACVRQAQERGLKPNDIKAPEMYVLGKGHMKFFYDKLCFLLNRQHMLVDEMLRRGYNPTFIDPLSLANGIDVHWFNDYEPTDDAIAISRARIQERLSNRRRARTRQA